MILFYPNKLKGYARIKLICDHIGIPYTYSLKDPFKVVMRNDYRLKRYGGVELADYPWINDFCVDVSKSYVESVFKRVFGYGSMAEGGRCLEKSEGQGTKDVKIVDEPGNKPGYVYQQIIHNKLDGHYIDFRTYVIGQEIVWIREKWKKDMIAPTIIRSRPAENPFNLYEQSQILDFCREMGMDYGELDILRDYTNGKLYIVDVNDMPGVRKNEPYQPGYKEELNTISRKFKEYYDNCSQVKNTGSPCGIGFC